MSNISLCMIVRDEEEVIGRCLDSVKDIVDEIVIIDTGSNDSTKDIASRYTDKIYDFKWIDDFSKARNFSFTKATKEYIMWLDADDVLFEEDRIKLKKLKEELLSTVDIVVMKYNVAFDENNNPTFSYNRERLMKRDKNYRWIGEIHEVIPQIGNIIYSDIAISHKKVKFNDTKRNLNIFEKMIVEGKEMDTRQKYYYARELYFNGMYTEAINKLEDFINSGEGWIENVINACSDLSKCYFCIGEGDKGLEALMKSFNFDEPRAEICCDIGEFFMKKENYKIAKFWYEIALTRNLDIESGGFKLIDCYGFIPYLQLCVCQDRLGNKQLSKEYNNKAERIKPNHPAVKYNKKYFQGLNI